MDDNPVLNAPTNQFSLERIVGAFRRVSIKTTQAATSLKACTDGEGVSHASHDYPTRQNSFQKVFPGTGQVQGYWCIIAAVQYDQNGHMLSTNPDPWAGAE